MLYEERSSHQKRVEIISDGLVNHFLAICGGGVGYQIFALHISERRVHGRRLSGLCCFPTSLETSAEDEAAVLPPMDEYKLLPDAEKLLLDTMVSVAVVMSGHIFVFCVCILIHKHGERKGSAISISTSGGLLTVSPQTYCR